MRATGLRRLAWALGPGLVAQGLWVLRTDRVASTDSIRQFSLYDGLLESLRQGGSTMAAWLVPDPRGWTSPLPHRALVAVVVAGLVTLVLTLGCALGHASAQGDRGPGSRAGGARRARVAADRGERDDGCKLSRDPRRLATRRRSGHPVRPTPPHAGHRAGDDGDHRGRFSLVDRRELDVSEIHVDRSGDRVVVRSEHGDRRRGAACTPGGLGLRARAMVALGRDRVGSHGRRRTSAVQQQAAGRVLPPPPAREGRSGDRGCGPNAGVRGSRIAPKMGEC